MKLKINEEQAAALDHYFDEIAVPATIDIDFQQRVGDVSGEFTQIAIDGRWLHRDGTWHDKSEPPSPRWVIQRPGTPVPYFKAYVDRGIRWTEKPEDGVWFRDAFTAWEFISTDDSLKQLKCTVVLYNAQD